ncbi:hypothetical protein ACFPT7_19595 [Acidicapsa dinghuensis]|uniref:Uncharacterized protein n=1 Tax=Acidicapsa dinghuensis TaxID=2218256 RepID=A0ABW1EJP4_9BACT|nr:hypothetical protein [Acidicapsa dinghuensis]
MLSAIHFRNRNYMPQPAPLLSLRILGNFHAPSASTWNESHTHLILRYADIDATAQIAVRQRPTHITFELVQLDSNQPVELVLWGSYPTTIHEIVGEIVGVVRDGECAIGIQALNVKTLGGYPNEESDIEPDSVEADDPGNYPGLPAELKNKQRWRGDTARLTANGSDLQAYCRNRDHARIISNWGWEKYDAPPFNDGGVIGSKIALFASPASESLSTLGAVEVSEGLPHPMLEGVWAKQSIHATDSYLIADFGEASIAHAIELTKRAGLRYLYQSSPFETWGHFELKRDLFPRGWDGFKYCVDEGRKAGIKVGFHMLSNFITTNDAYVTPKPDPRLAHIGTARLTAAIDPTQTEIPVDDPEYFQKHSALNTVVIGDELIQYEAVSAQSPWRLLQCKRGAFGTHASSHPIDATVGRLLDHDYKVFLTDTSLSIEVARNLARFCNHTGAQQTSLDGLEGNWSTGMGQYGCSLFTKTWWDEMRPEIREAFINDASMPHHFTWHIATRYNWGEPWYAGFRESQTMLRMKNQILYTRNLIPRMLGWFSLRKETTLEDAEWLGARSAGFDAGFALAISFESQAQQAAASGITIPADKLAILDAVKRWETARQSGAFPTHLKLSLQDVTREFHLVDIAPGEWELQPTNPAGPAVRVKSAPQGRVEKTDNP